MKKTLGQDSDATFSTFQLSSYLSATSDDTFPQIRWHQTADFGYVPNARMPSTFMAVAMDLCDRKSPFGSIHPRDKQTVAYRLHLGARAVAYGEKLIFQGPLPENLELLADKGLLNLTYSLEIQVQRQHNIFEVRRIVETVGVHPVWGVRIFSTLRPISLTITIL
ncbi:sialate O-acetylesterase-like [Leptonychotes weddellii]|uniref:Sialate O-acetylesterase-like n=1 Tax=Leptonychotes weddellii TaxID=9713 RepID=A0A7F8RKN3_LEPWE|nr:sialate O-acetylesterase-like [Leptonychotes weddellii]